MSDSQDKPKLEEAQRLLSDFDVLQAELAVAKSPSEELRSKLKEQILAMEEIITQIDWWYYRDSTTIGEYASLRVGARRRLMQTLTLNFSQAAGVSTTMHFPNTDLIKKGDKFYLESISSDLKTELSKGHIYEMYSITDEQVFLTDLSSSGQDLVFMTRAVFEKLTIQPL